MIDADPRGRYPYDMLNTHTFGINKGNNMFNVKKIAALGLMAVGMTFVGCMEQTGTTASSIYSTLILTHWPLSTLPCLISTVTVSKN